MKNFINDPYLVLFFVVCMSSVCSIISTLEWISLKNKFKNDNHYSWEILSLKVLTNKSLFAKKILNAIFSYPNVIAILYLQLFFSISIFFSFKSPLFLGFSCLGTSICYFLISYRRVDGYNGGDSMAKIVLLTGTICFLSKSNDITKIGLVFTSIQLILAYATPGLLRLFDIDWWNGKKLMYVLRMETFSKKNVYDFFNNRKRLIPIAAGSIILFESLFGFSVFLPLNALLVFLSLGIIFHITNAIIMGLNTFVWSFIGAYPAFIWTSLYLNEVITGANNV